MKTKRDLMRGFSHIRSFHISSLIRSGNLHGAKSLHNTVKNRLRYRQILIEIMNITIRSQESRHIQPCSLRELLFKHSEDCTIHK